MCSSSSAVIWSFRTPATFTVFHDYDALGNPVNPEEAVGDIDHEPLPAPVR